MSPIAIYGSRSQDDHLDSVARLFAMLADNRFGVSVHPKLARYLRDHGIDMRGAAVSTDIPADTGLVLSLGGDGTFMRAARWVGSREIPLLGVNTGHLGFLSSCRIDRVDEMLDAVCRGDIVVERRMMLQVSCDALPPGAWPYALNEVALLKDDRASMVTVRTSVDGDFLADFRCDGLIASTPTGSTAYNLSAGGSIVQPTLECICISAVAPHTLTVRPLVVRPDAVLEMTVECRSDSFRLSLDGCSHSVPAGMPVTVRRAGFGTMLVRRTGANFANVLRDKLLWNAGLC